MSIEIKRAMLQDMEAILELQVSVFEGEQKIPSELICSPGDNFLQWWCALEETNIVGAVAAWHENGQVHWGRFAVDPKCRGHQIGTRLARFSLEDLFSRGFDEIYMEAREVTVKIICGMGGTVAGEPTKFYEGTITPVTVTRNNYFFKRRHWKQ